MLMYMCRMKSIISVAETIHLNCFFLSFFIFFFYLIANSSSLQKTITGNKTCSKQLMNIANVTVLSMTDCRNISYLFGGIKKVSEIAPFNKKVCKLIAMYVFNIFLIKILRN